MLDPNEERAMTGGRRPDFDAYAGDLFGEIMLADTAPALAERKPLSRFVPGLAICAIASAAAAWLSQNYGVPVILAGLLLGLALNILARRHLWHYQIHGHPSRHRSDRCCWWLECSVDTVEAPFGRCDRRCVAAATWCVH